MLACAEVGWILSPRGAGIEILDIHFSKCDSRILSNFPLAAAGICFASIAQQTNPLVVVCHWWPGLFSIHGIYAVVVPISCWICISYLFDLRYQWFGWVYLCHNLQQILALFGRHQTKFQTDTSRCDLPRLVPSSAETLPATIDVAPHRSTAKRRSRTMEGDFRRSPNLGEVQKWRAVVRGCGGGAMPCKTLAKLCKIL